MRFKQFFTLKPFDTDTEEGRANERYRLATLSITANIFSRFFTALVMLLSVSWTLPYLGAERFGIWMTIASLVAVLTLLDLGVGNALTNRIASIATLNDNLSLSKAISGGLGFLLIISIIIALIIIPLGNIISWKNIIPTNNSTLNNEIQNAILVFSIIFPLHIFSNGLSRIFAGLQRSFESYLFSIFWSIFSIIALWFASKEHVGIPYLLMIVLGSSSIANLNSLMLLISRGLFSAKAMITELKNESTHLFSSGILFFILQVGTTIGWSADSLIISSTIGVAEVATFAIVQRLYQLATQPLMIMNTPLWGAYADATQRRDYKFIKKTLTRSIVITFLSSILITISITIFGDHFVTIWTHNQIHISIYLFISYGVWAILESTGNSLAMFLNGTGIIKPQIYAVILFSFCSVLAKLYLANNYGLVSMLLGNSIIYFLVTVSVYGIFFRKELLEKMTSPTNMVNKHEVQHL